MPMTGVISGVVTPKDKTKSNPLARLKVRIFSKSAVSFDINYFEITLPLIAVLLWIYLLLLRVGPGIHF